MNLRHLLAIHEIWYTCAQIYCIFQTSAIPSQHWRQCGVGFSETLKEVLWERRGSHLAYTASGPLKTNTAVKPHHEHDDQNHEDQDEDDDADDADEDEAYRRSYEKLHTVKPWKKHTN